MITYKGKNIEDYATVDYDLTCPYDRKAKGKKWADIVYCENESCDKTGCVWSPYRNIPEFGS